MAEYKISGIWKTGNAITHYAMHKVNEDSISRAKKISKKDAIELLENPKNTAITWIWNYKRNFWDDGQIVEVVDAAEKYLKTNPDSKETNNLAHLIDYDWISS